MKSETKDTALLILFAVLIVFNVFAIAQTLSSCLCSIEDTDCIESCEQKIMSQHTTCFAVNVVSLIVLGVIMWVWSKNDR